MYKFLAFHQMMIKRALRLCCDKNEIVVYQRAMSRVFNEHCTFCGSYGHTYVKCPILNEWKLDAEPSVSRYAQSWFTNENSKNQAEESTKKVNLENSLKTKRNLINANFKLNQQLHDNSSSLEFGKQLMDDTLSNKSFMQNKSFGKEDQGGGGQGGWETPANFKRKNKEVLN